MKIIGVEFRVGFGYDNNRKAEIFLHPVQIDVPDPLLYAGAPGSTPQCNVTVHTSHGDVTSGEIGLIQLPMPDDWWKNPISTEQWSKMRSDWIEQLGGTRGAGALR